ncbi:uncharacterized protein EMH_0084770 [Eimeria mitis]|uniref:Uncharacterized protein n=1 Tax=Eimeria mitis TaxID=44415 RepID=U6K6S3_9EIME|nr:uncharacterized protein EMH_0084770 [Eimeria mitis]CDJ33710.1 hypothetical protein, conserved [Eimeria mitis]
MRSIALRLLAPAVVAAALLHGDAAYYTHASEDTEAAAAVAAGGDEAEPATAADAASGATAAGSTVAAAAAAATATETAAEDKSIQETTDTTAKGILEKLKQFPGLGEHGAGLLQLAEEGLGIQASKWELKKMVPMLLDLQKNVHEHYMLTKGNGKYKPSSLLTRVVGQKSRNRVIRSMKNFAPDTDDGELIQQLDIVTQLLHELHTNPKNSVHEIMQTVSNAVGFNLEDEDMKELTGHMKWAHDLMEKVFTLLPSSLKGGKAEEL